MFTTNHFIWIGISAAFVALMLILGGKKNFSLKTAGYIMSAICIFSETSKIMSDMIESEAGGRVLDPRSLPFHLCSMMLFGVFFITFGKDGKAKQYVIDFISVMGALGSVCAILIPTNGTDFSSILSYQCFVYHAGLLWFSLYLIVSKKAKLGLKAYVRNVAVLLSLVLVMLYVNSILSVYNTNFMYLVRPPMKNLPFLNLNSGWYVYFMHVLSLGAVLISVFHLPFIVVEKKNKR